MRIIKAAVNQFVLITIPLWLWVLAYVKLAEDLKADRNGMRDMVSGKLWFWE